MRRSFGITLAISLWLLLAATAQGAQFLTEPYPTIAKSGAGPFVWTLTTTGAGYDSAHAYKVSTESVWHRCRVGTSTVTLAGLPDGEYSVAASNDKNLNAYGPGVGAAYPCFSFNVDTTEPPSGPFVTSKLIVDSTGPTVSAPFVTVSGLTAQISSVASDSLSGIKGYEFDFGDGVRLPSTNPSSRYTYLKAGTYNGALSATDNAGNKTTQPFTVTVGAAVSGSGTPQSPSGKPTTTGATDITLLEATGEVGRAIRFLTKRTAGSLRRSCRQTAPGPTSPRFDCQVTWKDSRAFWKGRLRLSYSLESDGYVYEPAFSGKRALRSCVIRKSKARCWRTAAL